MGVRPQKAGKRVINMATPPVALVLAAADLASVGAGPASGDVAGGREHSGWFFAILRGMDSAGSPRDGRE